MNQVFAYDTSAINNADPVIFDPDLKTELVSRGLESPTSMAFLAPNDILILEKNEGTVRRVMNGTLLPEPLLKVPVSSPGERGMLGIDIAKQENENITYVFLYFTTEGISGNNPPSNRLYRYELVSDKLIHPRLLLEIPIDKGFVHNGGVVLVGPDGNVYSIVGDLKGPDPQKNKPFNGRSGILRVSPEGKFIGVEGILGEDDPLNLYFAYGIRNSFGMDFDPVTGNLWDSENGAAFRDEINLVGPGFNSGWQFVQGMASQSRSFDSAGINSFGGRAVYSDPEFVWEVPIGVTAIKFLDSDKLGEQYENDLFAADINHGNLYHFDLNHNRTELLLQGSLADKIAKEPKEWDKILFGRGFNYNGSGSFQGITDLDVGPDGYLYVLSYGEGVIYKVVPKAS
jgi:glucose/arabinose dehydrogenase